MLPEIEEPQRFIETYVINNDEIVEEWWGYIRDGYYNKQFMHRVGAPAFTRRLSDGSIDCEIYAQGNTVHRIDGPAIIDYDPEGKVIGTDYFILGKRVSKKDFDTPGFIDAFILENS